MGLDFGGMASHYAQLNATIPRFHWLFVAFLFKLSTMVGQSIPWPLNVDCHSVNWPLGPLHTQD